MSPVDVVSNTSPLIYLALLNRFALLKQLFGVVYVPDAVVKEVTVRGSGQPGADETDAALEAGWMKSIAVQNRIAVDGLLDELHLGEAEAIVLARELNIQRILLDDRAARRKAAIMALSPTGTIGVLLLGKARGELIDIRHDLDRLIAENFRISPRLYAELVGDNNVGS
ncbi:MAG: DUF3368 domain-containing protein [Caldilineaceae bacterium]|nr:DUF3368 domain-containing protein [Caldilineaceae bacterium]